MSSIVRIARFRSSRKSRRVMRAPGWRLLSETVCWETSRVMGIEKRLPSARRTFSQTLGQLVFAASFSLDFSV